VKKTVAQVRNERNERTGVTPSSGVLSSVTAGNLISSFGALLPGSANGGGTSDTGFDGLAPWFMVSADSTGAKHMQNNY